MTLPKRPKTRLTDAAKIKTWAPPGCRYAVEEITSLYGLGVRYIVVETTPAGLQGIVSRHRKKSAAVKTLEKLCS
jgi:hypothetical protein